jgi:putative phosphoesterase
MTLQRVAVISDVHGNAPALAAVLEEIDGLDVDLIVSCGDLFAGPLPNESAALLTPRGDRVRYVRGNADREVATVYDGGTTPFDGPRHAGAVLSAEHRALLDTFAPTVLISVDGLGDVCCCHGTPTSDETILTYLTTDERLAAELSGAPAPTVIGGHTHMQVDRTAGGVRYVNAGSVGMPYEGVPGAYWALLGPDVEHRRTEYDLAAATGAILASGMPAAEVFAAEYVASSHPREETARTLEARAAG